MKTRLGWTGLLLASILMACGQPQAEVTPPTPQTPPKPAPVAFKPTMLGSVTIDFDSRAKTATAHFEGQTRATSFPAETDFKFTKAILQVQTPTAATSRFLTANFSLENLNATNDYNNVTLIAYHKRSVVGSENVGGSAFTNIIDFSGATIAASDLVKSLKPTHGMTSDGAGGYKVDDAHADMQIFTPSETSTIETDAQTNGLINAGAITGEGVLSYGYVARNASNGRSILHGTNNNSLTIGLQVPTSGDAGAGNTAYRYSETFLIFADNVTRVTESLEEQASSGAGARATALGATEVRYLCGSSYAASNGVFIPGAKTVGVSSVVSYLGGNLKITDNTAFNFTAIGNTPLAVNAASGLLTKYASLDGTALTTTGATSSTNGANVVVSSDGSFTFDPAVGSSIGDTFAYSPNGCTVPALKAPVGISNMVWYVNNTSTGAGTGRKSDPFQSLASAATASLANHIIYVYKGDGTSTNQNAGITLKSGQKLIGQGVDLTVNTTTIETATTNPVIGNSAGTAVALNSNNTVSGLDIVAASGTGISGSSFGTLNLSSTSITSTGGPVLNLATGALNGSVASLSSTSSTTTGLNLNTVSGSLTASTGTTISSPTTLGINVTGSSANLSLGNVSVTKTSAGVGINLSTNTGTFTAGTLNSTTSSGSALVASSVGTITSTSGTLTATGGAALDITSSPLSMVLTKLNSSSTTTNNLKLSSTTGSLTVNGTGTTAGSGGTLTTTSAESVLLSTAGTLTLKNMDITGVTGLKASSFTALNVSNSSIKGTNGAGLDLNNGAAAMTLTKLDSTGGVNNLKLLKVTGYVDVIPDILTAGSGGTLSAATADGVLLDNATTAVSDSFALNLAYMIISSPAANGVNIKAAPTSNTATTSVTLRQTSVTLSGTSTGHGFQAQLGGSASTSNTINLTNSSISNGALSNVLIHTQAGSNARVDAIVSGGVFLNSKANSSISTVLESGNTTGSTVILQNATITNTATGSDAGGVWFEQDSPAGSGTTSTARFSGNTITLNSTTGIGNGFDVYNKGTANAQVNIDNNTISNFGTAGIQSGTGTNAVPAVASGRLDLTLNNNAFSTSNLNAFAVMYLYSGINATGSSTLCLKPTNNSYTGGAALNTAGGFAYGFSLFQKSGHNFLLNAGSAITNAGTAVTAMQNYFNAQSNALDFANAPGDVLTSSSYIVNYQPGTCTTPSL